MIPAGLTVFGNRNSVIQGDAGTYGVWIRERSATGDFVDPDSVTVKIRKPGVAFSEAPDTYTYNEDEEVVRSGPGCYRIDLLFDVPGEWVIRWEVGENYKAAIEFSQSVLISRVLQRA